MRDDPDLRGADKMVDLYRVADRPEEEVVRGGEGTFLRVGVQN